jgi:hypothetical protein
MPRPRLKIRFNIEPVEKFRHRKAVLRVPYDSYKEPNTLEPLDLFHRSIIK